MRILLINERIEFGGTEVQMMREIKYFEEKHHEMYLLTFDPVFPSSSEYNHYNVPIQFNFIKKILNRFFCNFKYYKSVSEIIDEIRPDVIHVNNVFCLPHVVYKAVFRYPTVQTIRDYAVVCPKGTCIYEDGNVCKGYLLSNCVSCLIRAPQVWIKYFCLKRINRMRIKSVNKCVAPSVALSELCTLNGIETKCLNNPFDFSILTNRRKVIEKKVYFYYGVISSIKGVSILLNAFKTFASNKPDVELWIAGSIVPSYESYFKTMLLESNNIKYLGKYSNENIMKLYDKIWCVVVPSLWIENYPNTVLEAIANKTMVIGSNRGGIPELVERKEYMFDILNLSDILNCLERTYTISIEDYLKVTESRYEFILSNNSQEKYYYCLYDIYKSLLVKNCTSVKI